MLAAAQSVTRPRHHFPASSCTRSVPLQTFTDTAHSRWQKALVM